MPRLDDERFYPAFGSVYRIKESLDKGKPRWRPLPTI